MKFFYLTLISCFLFLSCESDDSSSQSQSNQLLADFKVPLLEDNTNMFEFGFSNEEGIFGFTKNEYAYNQMVQIHKDGTIDVLLTPERLDSDKYDRPVITSVKHASTQTLTHNDIYLLKNNTLYKYDKDKKSLRIFRKFDSDTNRIINISHLPHTDYFIVNDVTNKAIGYFSMTSNTSPIEYIQYTIGNSFEIWSPFQKPVNFGNRMYFTGDISDWQNIAQLEYQQTEGNLTFKYDDVFSKTENINNHLQVDSEGNLYVTTDLKGFTLLDIKKQQTVPLFIEGNQLHKYNIRYKNTSELDELNVLERERLPYGSIVNVISNYMVLDNDLYIIKREDLIKISNFKKQLKSTNPKQ